MHEGWTCTSGADTTYLKFHTWTQGGKWILDSNDLDTNGITMTWAKAADTGNGCPPQSGWDSQHTGRCKNFGTKDPVDPNDPNIWGIPTTTTTTTTTTTIATTPTPRQNLK